MKKENDIENNFLLARKEYLEKKVRYWKQRLWEVETKILEKKQFKDIKKEINGNE